MHDSGEDFDRPKCHENTRVAVLQKLMGWIVEDADAEKFIMWLYGDAGAGKSTIGQTVALMCAERNLLLGSFFFSRTDARRSTLDPLIATIAYQAATIIPTLKDLIVAVIERDTHIFKKNLSKQLKSLLIEPLNTLGQRDKPPFPYFILMDGLDECSDPEEQSHIVQVLAEIIPKCDIPLRIVIASRAEVDIKATFNSPDLQRCSTRIALDNSFQPDRDIWVVPF